MTRSRQSLNLFSSAESSLLSAVDYFVPPPPQSGTSKIVFASNREGSMQIYVMNSDGSGMTRLTYSGANDDFPRWSPNGAKILFQSDRDHLDTGYMDIYVMNSDGGAVTRLTSDASDDSMPMWSPDGTKIVFQSMRNGLNYQVYSMNADGSNQVNLTNNASSDGEPSWSPDGTKILFASDRDHSGYDSIYVMNSNGSNQQRLTFSAASVDDTQPFWSPDGGRIAFVSTRDSVLETWTETDDDGIVITKSALHKNKEIYVMNADGSGQTRLTNELANDDSPSWSPDGSKIIWRSDRERDCCDPSAQMWTMNADGSGQINLSSSGNGDYSASWVTGVAYNNSQLASDYSGGNQTPVANAGGPYVTQSGQVVQLNGAGSFDPNGTIVSYSWNFGDGGSGTGAIVNHQYNSGGVYSVSLSVSDNNGNTASSQGFVTVDSVAFPGTIAFERLPDESLLPNNTVVNEQWLSFYGVRFSTITSPLHTYQDCGFCSTTSPPNFVSTKPDDKQPVIVEFTQPVSNLKFFIIGIDVFFDQFAILDVYRNGSLYGSFAIFGNGTTTREISLGPWDNINKIVIRSITDPYGIGFDDFSFNVPADVKITSGRVGGYLNGTTQNALLGADVALNASPLPGAFAGGTYAWTCTPAQLCPILGSANSSSVTLRTNEVGTFTATVSYTKNGLTTSGSVTINSILPTLNSFTAQVAPEQITRDRYCSTVSSILGARYSLGCYQLAPAGAPPLADDGIIFTAQAQIPTQQYLSNPGQSGIKIRQVISTLRKRVNDWPKGNGNFECATVRTSPGSSPAEIDSGWQLDGVEAMTYFVHTPPTFAQGNTLTYTAFDAPADSLDSTNSTIAGSFKTNDVLFVDDRFQAYVYYYVGGPLNPIFQRPLKLVNAPFNFSYIDWRWNGQAIFYYDFDPTNNLKYRLQFTNTPSLFTSSTSTLPTERGNVTPPYAQCLGDPAPSTNMIDGAKCFVLQQYWDFLNRAPDDRPDNRGWDFWTADITQCAFDRNCIEWQRVHVAYSFFISDELIRSDPAMANPPGSQGFDPTIYNPAFIRHCYQIFLRRNPEEEGFNFWLNDLNSTGDYWHIINAFIKSDEYRGRINSFIHPFHCCGPKGFLDSCVTGS